MYGYCIPSFASYQREKRVAFSIKILGACHDKFSFQLFAMLCHFILYLFVCNKYYVEWMKFVI